jgi:hypothetical protein
MGHAEHLVIPVADRLVHYSEWFLPITAVMHYLQLY